MKHKKDLDFLKGLYIAHRGLHDNNGPAPENSMPAFENAAARNIPIEFDLHLLKDNKIAVFHDDNLKRMTGSDKNIKDCTYDEIKNLKLLKTDCAIPLFEELLDFVNGKVLLDIEFKTDIKAGLLEEKASLLLDNYKGKFIVKSFSPFSVQWFKQHRPGFIRGQLSYDFIGEDSISPLTKFICKNMLLNPVAKPDFIAYGLQSLPSKKVAYLRRRGKPIFVWTINGSADLEKAKQYGDSFIFNSL